MVVTSFLVLGFGGMVACSSSPSSPETSVSSSTEAVSICNCPLETGDASCTCAPTADEHERCRHGERWDHGRCERRPKPECVTAADCSGPLPQLCEVCADGGDGCAHFACVDGDCEIAFCP
jgi:hypothetical protein